MSHRNTITLRAFVVGSIVAIASCRSLGTPTSVPLPQKPWVTIGYSPGMMGTPPWEIRITSDGQVFLEANQYENDSTITTRYEQQRLTKAEQDTLWSAIEAAELHTLQPLYEYGATDQETLRIAIAAPRPAVVTVYGPQGLCDRSEVQRFLRVWNAVIRRVSVPTTRYTHHVYGDCYASERAG